MKTGRVLRLVALLIFAASVLFALLPFRGSTVVVVKTAGTPSQSRTIHASCGAPIVDAWHGKNAARTGFSPLTSVRPRSTGCRHSAQRRLVLSVIGVIAALVLLVGAYLIDRRRFDFGPEPRAV